MLELTNNVVKLIYARCPEYSINSAYYIDGYVTVENFGFDKNIIIHYTYDCESWLTCSASYITDAKENHEIWYFRTPSTNDHSACNFAICYKTNDKEYWDNNQNKNYKLKWYSPTKILQSCNIIIDKVFKSSTAFYGNILVKNLAYHKKVRVRYSFDNWQNSSEWDAIYSQEIVNRLELWKFYIPLTFYCEIKFNICYIVEGITYSDNNFGMNYSI
ncbi:carbohydrate-binding protein [Desnuesiella massiliensis]|uniref:carbohydrate-binding protein n=1 Tax=Desnuesiella massiliensis TaxID=1650662 RepID=UPI0006E4391D|nr:carbohydrate-binding protein [Desnuesiella massiliensis]